MNMAAKAVTNAIAFEAKKDGLSQRQDGSWQLRFTVAALDMDNRITTAAMGARFQCVLVEINDDETPVDHVAKQRDKWRDLGPVKQAGIRCKEPTFRAYLRTRRPADGSIHDEDSAAEFVRIHCGVTSRADLSQPSFSDARIKWYQLDDAYQAWFQSTSVIG